MRSFTRNNETGKIELSFDKADYLSLTDEEKKHIRSNFLFSNYRKAWVSRAKNNTYSAEGVCKQLGAIWGGETGSALSFAERVERTQEKAGSRAERYNNRALKANRESTQHWEASNEGKDFLSLGEPIKIGHHSEKRHRALIDRNHRRMSKSVELGRKAEYYQDRAETAAYTAEGTQYKNPIYLGNRIRETEATLRKLNRYLSGIDFINRETGETSTKENPATISERQKAQYQNRITEETDKLNFYTKCLQDCGLESKDSLKAKKCTHIMYRGKWYPVKSINDKSVTILNWMSIPGNAWKWAVHYPDITGVKTVEDNFKVFDRDGNENKPQVKHK